MKRKIKQFYNWLISETKRREKYYSKQTDKWKETKTGAKYLYENDVLNELLSNMIWNIEELEIEINQRKY